MVRAGDIIENPVLGDTIRVVRTGAETNGELFEAEIALAPHAPGPPLHVHPTLEDRLPARRGLLGVQSGDTVRTLTSCSSAAGARC